MLAAWSARGIAHGAGEIARGGDLHQADAGVLLMLAAQTAIERAAAARLDTRLQRQLRRQAVFKLIVLPHVGANVILALAVRRAALAEVNPPAARDNLRRHQGQALRAKALGCAQERIIAQLHQRPFLRQRDRYRTKAVPPAAIKPVPTAIQIPAISVPPSSSARPTGKQVSRNAAQAATAITVTTASEARNVTILPPTSASPPAALRRR